MYSGFLPEIIELCPSAGNGMDAILKITKRNKEIVQYVSSPRFRLPRLGFFVTSVCMHTYMPVSYL